VLSEIYISSEIRVEWNPHHRDIEEHYD